MSLFSCTAFHERGSFLQLPGADALYRANCWHKYHWFFFLVVGQIPGSCRKTPRKTPREPLQICTHMVCFQHDE